MSFRAELITDPRSQYEVDRKFTKFYLNYSPKTPLGDNYKPNYCVLPAKYAEIHDKIQEFEVRSDDVLLCGISKSGTTWAQEMVWLINNNLDYETAKSQNLLYERFRLLEYESLKANETEILGLNDSEIDLLNRTKSPRHIKCHLPMAFLPTAVWKIQPKIIYVMRNPKDAAISYYHHMKSMRGFKGNLDDFFGLYLSGQVLCGPYFDHVMGFWKLRHLPNILLLTYEDMKRDLKDVLQKIADFLGKSLSNDEIHTLYEHLQVDSMRQNPSCNFEERIQKAAINKEFKFIRRGIAGAYKDEMPAHWINKFDEEIRVHMGNCTFYQ
ncbi:luciferin sulfotransferase-like [Bradysia coprophila]|uniref:luciferin sulfotransferase-like n=1 Tax=Bradysia coprophila TaxID=38358 RepID=UPI00187D9A5E|nr:luciferin sulfotransferase-like [Bradysia coprophila]